MTDLTPFAPHADAPPRAIGQMRLSTKRHAGRTVLDTLYQKGASKVVFPRSPLGCTGVMLNTSGGVTGGDRFENEAVAGAGTHLCLTTQACERAYRAFPGQVGRIRTVLRVEDGATLWWLPQETLLFDGCDLDRRLSCDLAPGARALIVEPVCFGRIAMGETRVTGRVSDRIAINQCGAPLVMDGWELTGDMTAQLAHKAVGSGAAAMVSLTYVAPDAERHLDPLRDLLPPAGGASLLAENTLVMRLLAPTGFELRRSLLPILDHLTGGHLPLCWRL
ncbi:urease accessory protein UreD [uncultured Tateyamaria sp.]|uniref:urease accessory protein UreD n=1 Tax=uncultured Tateyamaria sp. TaxID=455651 RepID=UPI00262F2E08|nr:urease accessory protein UreD [uncultured Tateyamaria sp.]